MSSILRNRPRIFISYSFADEQFVQALNSVLRVAGAEPVIASNNIKIGDSFPQYMNTELGNCDFFLLIWSSSSVHSHWVEQEWQSAFARRMKVVPCRLNNIPLPPALAHLVYADFIDINDVEYIRDNLKRVLSALHLFQPEVAQQCAHIFYSAYSAFTPPTPRGQQSKPTIRIKPNVARTITITIVMFIALYLIYNFVNFPIKDQKFSFASPSSNEESFLSNAEVRQRIIERDFFDSIQNPGGKGIRHLYKRRENIAVNDVANGLTWQQSGSLEAVTFKQAEHYILDLNTRRFAGFKDWRLPKLEEVMGLLTPHRTGELYLDICFDDKPKWVWTRNRMNVENIWVVDFRRGMTSSFHASKKVYVRAVRSSQ